jgi:hypothetical protein
MTTCFTTPGGREATAAKITAALEEAGIRGSSTRMVAGQCTPSEIAEAQVLTTIACWRAVNVRFSHR